MIKPLEKKKEPKPIEIAIAAFLSVMVGVVGAVVFLVMQPPEKVTEIPAEEDRQLGYLYVVEGKAGNASHDTWQAKKAAVEATRSGSLTLVEEELNRWAAAELNPGDERIEKAFLSVAPDVPRFRIGDERLTVRVPLTWAAFGVSRTFDAQASGHFTRRGATHVFEHDRVYMGSCPLPGFVANRLIDDVSSLYAVSDGLRNGWAALETVAIDGDGLNLDIP